MVQVRLVTHDGRDPEEVIAAFRAIPSGSPPKVDPKVLRDLYVTKVHSKAEVGRILGLNRKHLDRVMSEHGIPVRKANNQKKLHVDLEQAVVLRKRGWTFKRIAQHLGLSETTLRRRFIRARLHLPTLSRGRGSQATFVRLTCEHCGKSFPYNKRIYEYRLRAGANPQKYCSAQCHRESRRKKSLKGQNPGS